MSPVTERIKKRKTYQLMTIKGISPRTLFRTYGSHAWYDDDDGGGGGGNIAEVGSHCTSLS